MLNFFYKKDFNIRNEFTNIEELFEILEVADRYQVEILVDLCKKSLLRFPMELESMIQIVNTAKYYRDLDTFATLSQNIMERAINFLETKLQTAAHVLNFLGKSYTDNPILEDSIKLELLKKMASRKCEKCGEKVSNQVFRENMAVGAWVDVRSHFRYDRSKITDVVEKGKLTRLPDTEYTLAWKMR